MRLLITGSNGLTGQKIVGQLRNSQHQFLATSNGSNRNPDCPDSCFATMDIANRLQVKEILDRFRPDAVINTAAMTNVDQCEDQPDLCRKINVLGVQILHDFCKLRNIHLVQLSTDFVFDGANGPYKEDDTRNPLSIYAQSKFDAENILMESDYNNWSILRTIIVYGKCPNMSRTNIVLWAIDSLKKGQELKIVNDQFRAPTWADDLAWACIKSVEKKACGIFHICGPDIFSMYDLVLKIADYLDADKNLVFPISSSTLNQKAKRPPATGFLLDKARKELGFNPKSFVQTLAHLIQDQKI